VEALRSDLVSFNKVRDVPIDVTRRNADTLAGQDSADFAASDHQHATTIRKSTRTVASHESGVEFLKMC
jgi:hypothetical protein